jgi:hypothetical protein
VAKAAIAAMRDAEASAKQAIESALPVVSGGEETPPYVPPELLYTEHLPEEACVRMRIHMPTEVLALTLRGAMVAQSYDEVVEMYAQVLDDGEFEHALCKRDADADKVADDTAKLLLKTIPEILESSTESAVAIAEMLARRTDTREAAREAMREAMRAAAVSAARPASGLATWIFSKFTTPPSAVDLRNLEVVVRTLRAGSPTEANVTLELEIVARVREATWRAVVEHSRLDVTRFGARYGVVPLPVLRDYTVQLMPDPVPQPDQVANFGLGEWGVLDSLRRLVHFAAERFKQSDPEKAAKIAAYAERGQSLGQELLGLYVVRQHVGFERAGVGYALAVATETLRALRAPRRARYAHAIRCVLGYVRALLFDDKGDGAGIESVVSALEPGAATREPAYTLPAVPRACRSGPVGHDARTRRLVRDACAANAELVEKAKARAWLEETFGKSAGQSAKGRAVTVDEMFEKHDALGALALVGHEVVTNVRATLDGMRAATVTQRRRLDVMRTRVGATRGADDEAYVHRYLEERARAKEPHGLVAHEFGVAHTAFYIGPTVVYRAPVVEAEAAGAHGSWMGRLLARLVPDRVQGVVDAASDAASGRRVQYRGGEPPGVGYAIYALLPVLDHASAMLKAGEREYDVVQQRTLHALGRLLSPSG